MARTSSSEKDIVKIEDLGEYFWFQGYFHPGLDQGKIAIRDYNELRLRDEALFTLGDICNKDVVDIGCGSGLYALTMLKMGVNHLYAQDIDPEAIDEAKQICAKNGFQNLTTMIGDCAQLQFEDNQFDFAFSGDVFEHITDEQKTQFILEAYRVLKPGGLFTIKTPNKNYLKLTNLLHRLVALLKFKNPFNVHIAHTRNNPDNEHHGLINHKKLIKIINGTMFHDPKIHLTYLDKKGFPLRLAKALKNIKFLNEHIIITIRKPIFYGFYK